MSGAFSRRDLLPIKDRVVANFNHGHWQELGILTDCSDLIDNHPRLLRSLTFQDPDHEGCALSVLSTMVDRDPANLSEIRDYIDKRFPDTGGFNVSSAPGTGPRIVFQPTVFAVPQAMPDPDLLTVMMPFEGSFRPVYESIRAAAERNGMTCQRADDIWIDATVIQDVFSLLFRSHIVVCDFSGRNPNVFYEAGIAHTLGKHVIPITQHAEDIPFDLRHHRYLRYLNNREGIVELQRELEKRIKHLAASRA